MRAKRVDANHAEVVTYLRSVGWSVCSTASIGNGFPDLIVGRKGFACVVEVKDGSKPPSARKLTPDEARFRELWGGPYVLATSPEDAAEQLLAQWRVWK